MIKSQFSLVHNQIIVLVICDQIMVLVAYDLRSHSNTIDFTYICDQIYYNSNVSILKSFIMLQSYNIKH